MSTVDDVRHGNLLRLIARAGGQRALADQVAEADGKPFAPAQISQWVTRAPDLRSGRARVMHSTSARRIEAALGLPPGWMDQTHADAEAPAATPSPAPAPALSAGERLSLEQAVAQLGTQLRAELHDRWLTDQIEFQLGVIVLIDWLREARPLEVAGLRRKLRQVMRDIRADPETSILGLMDQAATAEEAALRVVGAVSARSTTVGSGS